MAEPFLAHISHIFHLSSGERARLVQEPAIGSVIPDLLLGIWSGDLPPCKGLNHVSRQIVTGLAERDGFCYEDEIREQLFISEHASRSALLALERIGAVSKLKSGEVYLEPGFAKLETVRLVAIEMKLVRWRQALQQAVRYSLFADECYVVLDSQRVTLTDQIRTAFEVAGIGLLLQGIEGLERTIDPKPQKKAPSTERLFALTKIASGPYCLA